MHCQKMNDFFEMFQKNCITFDSNQKLTHRDLWRVPSRINWNFSEFTNSFQRYTGMSADLERCAVNIKGEKEFMGMC